MRGFGQDPVLPPIPGLTLPPGVQKPVIPGYVSDESHNAAMASAQAAYDTRMKIGYGIGVGILIVGVVIGKSLKK